MRADDVLRSKSDARTARHTLFQRGGNRRVRSGGVQRSLVFGEINDSQQAAWRQTLEVLMKPSSGRRR